MASTNIIDKSVHIKSTPEKILEFLTTPGKVQLALPGLVETLDTPEGRMQEDSSFRYKYQMYGVMLEGTWHVVTIEAPSKYVGKTSGAASSTWSYTLSTEGDETKLQLHIQYDIPSTVIEKAVVSVVSAMNEKEIDTYLENLKSIFELQ